MPRRKTTRRPPLVHCEPSTALFLGAKPLHSVQHEPDARDAVIAIRSSDGRCWIWPVESELYAAILRA